MNDIIQNMIRRRSCRRYNGQPLTQPELEDILQAGRWAPTGGNSQNTHFLVIRDPAILEELRRRVQAAFAGMEITEGMYKSVQSSIRQSKTGAYAYDYHAPAVILVAAPHTYPNAMADCACALENMMLAATSLSIGSCWVNQLRWLNDDPAIHAYLETLGLDPAEQVCGGVALGHYDGALGEPRPRQGMPVTWVGEG